MNSIGAYSVYKRLLELVRMSADQLQSRDLFYGPVQELPFCDKKWLATDICPCISESSNGICFLLYHLVH
jgi:hypothetical protein